MLQSGQLWPVAHDEGGLVVKRTAYPSGYVSEWHDAPYAQLVYPSRGVMLFRTEHAEWVVPPLRACWLPARERHLVKAHGRLEMHSVYASGAILDRLPAKAGIVAVSPLLRELILALEALPPSEPPATRMAAVLADQIVLRPMPLLGVLSLSSKRLQSIAHALTADPSDARTLKQWAAELNTSPRTLARALHREAGMTFGAYRQQIRLRSAICKLAEGEAVTSIAYDLGFTSPSSFIAAFRRATGFTPKRYFAV